MVEDTTKPTYHNDQSGVDVIADNSSLDRTADKRLERFVCHMTEAMNFYDNFDPYTPDPLKPMNDKINRFLEKYLGINYEEFLRQARSYTLEGEDYDLIPQRLMRKLFDHRARIYLAAFDSCEQEGLNAPELLEIVRKAKLPPIKKGEVEPTFEKMVELLTSSPSWKRL